MKFRFLYCSFLLFITFFSSTLLAQTVVINEFLASNSTINTDQDGDYSDWIELYNSGSESVDLTGYTLTDDSTLPAQWTFPVTSLAPGQFLLVWASGKDRTSGELHTNFKLSAGGEFVGLYNSSGAVVDSITFDVQTADISMARPTDGNGEFELTTTPTPAGANIITSTNEEIPEIVINEFLAANLGVNQDSYGNYSDWIELFNNGTEAINLEGFFLTDDENDKQKWVFPYVVVEPGNYLLVWASGKDRKGSELHTNFKLSVSGEFIGLFNPSGVLVDSRSFASQETDVSESRIPNGSGEFIKSYPSPNYKNAEGVPIHGVELTFSHESGYYNGAINVEITANDEIGVIYYSFRGEPVNQNSQDYYSPIPINTTTALRVRVYQDELAISKEYNLSYFIDFDSQLPVLSLVTDSTNLYGPTGIFDNLDGIGKDWERPVAVEYLPREKDGFQINSGMRIHGGITRRREYPKQSFRLYFRSEYGESKLNYKLFETKDLTEFDRLIIHSGGSFDQYYRHEGTFHNWTLLRDPLNHRLWQKENGNITDSDPTIVFINGELWGVYHLRERIEKFYIESNFDITDFDLLKVENGDILVKEGDMDEWNNTFSYFQNNSLKTETYYNEAAELIDVNNFSDFYIV